jgi:hypothetical protein
MSAAPAGHKAERATRQPGRRPIPRTDFSGDDPELSNLEVAGRPGRRYARRSHPPRPAGRCGWIGGPSRQEGKVSNTTGDQHARDLRLRALLVPKDEHPARDLITLELGVKQLGDAPPPLPWGMVWDPPTCENYFETAVPNAYAGHGWMRTTDRRSPTFSHDNFYLDSVIEVPGGVDLDALRRTALTCRSGRLTLDGRVTGTVTYTEVEAPKLSRSKALAMRIEVRIGAPKDDEDAAIIAKYRYGGGRRAVANIKEVQHVVSGNLLFTVLSPKPGLARQMAEAVHGRYLRADLG